MSTAVPPHQAERPEHPEAEQPDPTRPTSDGSGPGRSARSPVSRRAVRLVAEREVRASMQKRSFWIGAAITLAIVLAIAILPGVLDDDSATTRTVALGPDRVELEAPLAAIDDATEDLTIEISTFEDAGGARSVAAEGEVDAAVVGDTIFVDDDAPDDLVAVLDQSARTARVATGVENGSVDPAVADVLAAPQVLSVEALDPTDTEQQARQAMTVFGIFLIFVQIFGFGYAVAGGIVEEKSSRVVEVLLAKVRPGELLAGKVVGIWLLTTAQMIAIAVVGLVAATASGTLDLPPGWFGVVAFLLLWYVVAYVFYACVFAICGALAASAEEMQSTTTPATILVMLGYGAAFVALNDPEGTIAAVASFVPAFAPLVMPIRAVLGDAPAWEVVLSIGITLGVGAALIPVAGRIYRGSVLTSRQTKLAAAWRSART
jgi:ABC-2 type transport system permease protein